MSARVVHFEIPYDDADRATNFYRTAFGWDIMPMPEMDYVIVGTGPTDQTSGPKEPGFINGGMFPRREGFSAPNIVLDVPSIDEALKTVASAGGSKVSDKMAVGTMGFAAYFTDTEGNLVGLWETAAQS